MRATLLLVFSLALAASLVAAPKTAPKATVRLTPDFTFLGAGNKTRTLRSLRGQPVVLIVADSPDAKLFRKQLKVLRRGYSQFASRQAIFVAAFRQGEGPVRSNVPFIVTNNGPAVAEAYGLKGDFTVVIIGKDGNLDYQTDNVVAPERMIDVMQNGLPVQTESRKAIE